MNLFENFSNTKKEVLSSTIVTLIVSLILYIFGLFHFVLTAIKDFTLFYISNYTLIFLILISIITIIFFKRKQIKDIVIYFIILIAIATTHSIILFNTQHNQIDILYYGLYENKNGVLYKSDISYNFDNYIISNLNKNEELIPVKEFYLPNHITMFLNKDELLNYFQDKQQSLSFIVIKENELFYIKSFANKSMYDDRNHMESGLQYIDNIFNNIINSKNINKKELINDYIKYYQNLIIRGFGNNLLILGGSYKDTLNIYNTTTNSIFNILLKYKKLVVNVDLLNKLDILLIKEKAGSKYILSSINEIAGEVDSSIVNMIECLALSPYYPYDTLEEFTKAYETTYHEDLVKSLELVKKVIDVNGTQNTNDKFESTNYTKIITQKQKGLKLALHKFYRILNNNTFSPETYNFIEEKLELMSKENTNHIYKFFYADIIKFIPKGKEKFNAIYMERINQSIKLYKQYLKYDKNMLDKLVYIKMIALYVTDNTKNNIHEKEILQLINKIGNNRRIYGPSP